MEQYKLNFGCGPRYAEGWENIDFNSVGKSVRRVNLLAGFPYQDDTFNAVYSSHVLEHFTKQQGVSLVKESYRVLKTGGVLRIVVPDFKASCDEYMRIISMPDSAEKLKYYEWIMIELLDQMVRDRVGGEMGSFIDKLWREGDKDFKEYVVSRVERVEWVDPATMTFYKKLRQATPQQVMTKLFEVYLKMVSLLVPKTLRNMVFVRTSIGEKHRWMYDEYGLTSLFQQVGFKDIRRVKFNESRISNFNSYHLDCNPDGSSYKNCSLYIEGIKQ